MDRRTFLGTLAGGLFAAPLTAQAQRPKVPKIGVLVLADLEHTQATLREALRGLGYVEGQNLLVELRRLPTAQADRLPEFAADLVRLNVDVIVASPTEAIRAAQQATRTIPIVMATSGDPVRLGFIASLAHPGGNITGLTSAASVLIAKRLDLLKAIAPAMSLVAFLGNRSTPKQFVRDMEAAGPTLGLQVTPVMVDDARGLERTFEAMAKAQVAGLVVDLVLGEYRRQIADLAIQHRLPTISGPREFVEAGGLMAYGPDYEDLFRRAATYVDKILKGAKPADLPVEQPTKFELVINLRTSKALALTIPPSLLLRADQVIE